MFMVPTSVTAGKVSSQQKMVILVKVRLLLCQAKLSMCTLFNSKCRPNFHSICAAQVMPEDDCELHPAAEKAKENSSYWKIQFIFMPAWVWKKSV